MFWSKSKHAFKFGVLFNRFQDNTAVYLSDGGSASFGSLASFFVGNYSSVTWTPQGFNQQSGAYWYNTLGFYAQDDFRIKPRLTLNLGLRYEFNTVPSKINGQTTYNLIPAPALYTAPFPFAQSGQLYRNPSLHDFSPRLGFAWDVFGTGKTAIRGGAGIYYDIGLVGSLMIQDSLATPPQAETIIINNTLAKPVVPLQIPFDNMCGLNPVNGSCNNIAISPVSLRGLQYNAGQPSLGEWNLTVDQQLPWQSAISISYVGSRGWHLYQTREDNPVVPSGTAANGLPTYVANQPRASGVNSPLGQVLLVQETGESWYDGLQTSFNKRISRGLQFQAAYTFSKMLDDGLGQLPTDGTVATEGVGNPEGIDKGLSSYNVTQNFRANAIYHFPDVKSDHFYSKFADGWWVATIVSMQTGFPLNVTLGTQRSLQNNSQDTDRPNLDPSFNYGSLITGGPVQYFNPTMFDVPAPGTLGNAPRNLLTSPHLRNADLSINKDTRLKWLGEGGKRRVSSGDVQLPESYKLRHTKHDLTKCRERNGARDWPDYELEFFELGGRADHPIRVSFPGNSTLVEGRVLGHYGRFQAAARNGPQLFFSCRGCTESSATNSE